MHQITRQFRSELQMLSAQRMFEVKDMGMKCLPRKGFQRRACGRRQLIRFGLDSGPVDLVAEKRVADGGEMDADLVGSSGLEPAGEQARDRRSTNPGVAFEHLPVGHGGPSSLTHGHLFAGVRMASHRLVDGAARPPGCAPDKGEVAAPQSSSAPVISERTRQCKVSAISLGNGKKPARVLVEAMHNAWALDAANAREAVAAMSE